MLDDTWVAGHQPSETKDTVLAAKLHVLGLTPLKRRLGSRWNHLSELVHKLFEKAIAHAQGPNDHFIVLDELSYAVTFASLSQTETSLVCASIAKEVCEHLFGNRIDEISVRSIVAEIVSPGAVDPASVGKHIEAALERNGVETVTTQSVRSGSTGPVVTVEPHRLCPEISALEQIRLAHARLSESGLRIGFLPVWELRKNSANTLLLVPFMGKGIRSVLAARSLLVNAGDELIADVEVDLLRAAAAYADRLHNEVKICAVCVGVSYDTMCCFKSRIRYITTLQKFRFAQSNPLLLKLEHVPEGAPDNRVAELIAMMNFANVRVLVEVSSIQSLPEFRLRLGASGLGSPLPFGISPYAAQILAERLVSRASSHRAFAYLDHLDSPELVAVAHHANVRFATGTALGSHFFTGLEPTPSFPLTMTTAREA